MNSFDKVYRGILRRLYEGQVLPGQRLIAPVLAQEFDASRNTVREVLTRLSAIGVLTMVRNQSPTVRLLSRSEMQDLLEVVRSLLALAADFGARSVPLPGRREGLQAAYDALSSSEIDGDLSRFVHARERYYRTLLQVGGNRELIRLFPTMHVHLMRLQLRSIPLVAQSAQLSDYVAINEAVLAGDRAGAAEAARRHVQNMMDAVSLLPDAMFAPEPPFELHIATEDLLELV
ncbi:FCD domain-containing protein [uncultured Brevundimonas sp.]|uniref:GntR family transcriptional regulator n=1 Tax=uncultured Brevundimonas sp. TaxID=213418 RepID=UPI0025D8528B|nr:FCD domain-containing protein [uncultured Brevundimonas sp.]